MCETDEYDELEIETVAAAQLFDDDIDCDERQFDEYGDYGIVEHHYHNSGGGGCLTLVSAALSLTILTLLLVLVF